MFWSNQLVLNFTVEDLKNARIKKMYQCGQQKLKNPSVDI